MPVLCVKESQFITLSTETKKIFESMYAINYFCTHDYKPWKTIGQPKPKKD